MAKQPRTPKPKLPKPKQPLGQRIRNEARSSIAKGLTKNFGVLGTAIAKRYVVAAKPPRRRVPDPGKANQKAIPKKGIKKDAPIVDSVLESAKQVASTIDIVALNAGRSFAVATRQAQIMGDEVTAGLRDVNNMLNRMLYKPPQPPPLPPEALGTPTSTSSQSVQADASGGGSTPFPIPVPSLKTMGILSIIPGLKMLGLMSGQGGMSASREEMKKEIEKNNQRPEAVEAQKRADAMRGWLGKWFGWTGLFKDAPMPDKAEIGKDNVMFKMTYKAEKISFKSENAIKFKTRSPVGAGFIRPQSGGFFNKLADKMTGGPGGAGFFNNLADRMFGTGSQMPGGVNSGGATGSAGSSGGSSPHPHSHDTEVPKADKNKTGDYKEGEVRLKHAQGNLNGLDPKLLHTMREASKDLPEGFHAEIISGRDARSTGTTNHPNGIASDIQIYDREGRLVPYNRSNDKGVQYYEKFHQSMVERGKVLYPDEKFIWGGGWISRAAGYGDPMHMQIKRPVPGSSQTSGKYDSDKGISRDSPFSSYMMSPEEVQSYKKKVQENIQKERERLYVGPNKEDKTEKEATPVEKESAGNTAMKAFDGFVGDGREQEEGSGFDFERWKWMRKKNPEDIDDRQNEDSSAWNTVTAQAAARARQIAGSRWMAAQPIPDPSILSMRLGSNNLDFALIANSRKDIRESLGLPDPKRSNRQQFIDESAGLNTQKTKQNQSIDISDFDHRPRREAVPPQKYDDYMGTSSGLEDAD